MLTTTKISLISKSSNCGRFKFSYNLNSMARNSSITILSIKLLMHLLEINWTILNIYRAASSAATTSAATFCSSARVWRTHRTTFPSDSYAIPTVCWNCNRSSTLFCMPGMWRYPLHPGNNVRVYVSQTTLNAHGRTYMCVFFWLLVLCHNRFTQWKSW